MIPEVHCCIEAIPTMIKSGIKNMIYIVVEDITQRGLTLWFGCQNAPNRYWRNLNLTGMISFDARVLWSATDMDSFDTAVWSFITGKT